MEWKELLEQENGKSMEEQQENREAIIKAFREMWKSNPTEQEFSDCVSGIVLFPECLFIMAKGG